MQELIDDRGDFLYETTIPFPECRDLRQYLDKCRGSSTLESRRQFESNDALSVPKNTGRGGLHKTTWPLGGPCSGRPLFGRAAFCCMTLAGLAAYAAAGLVPLNFKSAKVKGSPLCCSS